MGRTFFILLTCCVSITGCETVTQTSAVEASSAGGIELGDQVPRTLTVNSPVNIRRVYNASFPEFTVTVPSGQYSLDSALSRNTTLFYKASSATQLKIDSGQKVFGNRSSGYLIFPIDAFSKGEFDSSELEFAVPHTDQTRSLIDSAFSKIRSQAPKFPKSRKLATYMTFKIGYDEHIYGKGDRFIPNGNQLVVSFPKTSAE